MHTRSSHSGRSARDLQVVCRLSRRDEVDNANNTRLDALPGLCETFIALEYAGYNSKGERVSPETKDKLLDRLVVPKMIRLKVTALRSIIIKIPHLIFCHRSGPR